MQICYCTGERHAVEEEWKRLVRMCSKNYAFFSLDVLYAGPQIFFGKNRAYCIWVFTVVAWPSPSPRLQQTTSELWQLSGRYYPNCPLLHCVWHLYTIVCILVQTVHTSVALGFTMFSCTYFLTRSWFLFIFSAYFLLVVVSLVVIKCLKRLVSKMTYCVASGTLKVKVKVNVDLYSASSWTHL